MNKINKLSDYSGEDNFTSVFLKVNEIIDWINGHDTSGRHIIPSSKEGEPRPNKWCKIFNCGGSCKTKQSTSLKEEAEELIYKSIYKDKLTTTETADKILSLFQSYLVKEIKQQEMPGYQDEGAEHAHAGYVRALEDIIKIINNIC